MEVIKGYERISASLTQPVRKGVSPAAMTELGLTTLESEVRLKY
jgi:hypothetical protein